MRESMLRFQNILHVCYIHDDDGRHGYSGKVHYHDLGDGPL